MTISRLNRKQRLAIWGLLIFLFFCLTLGSWWLAGVAVIVDAVVVWKLGGADERPEIAVVKSVRCGGCGAIGEPHWKSCPRCEATNWV